MTFCGVREGGFALIDRGNNEKLTNNSRPKRKLKQIYINQCRRRTAPKWQ
jgi:hypothetical protein